MKLIVFVLSLVAICSCSTVNNDEHRQKVKKLMQDCADELTINSEELHKYQHDTVNFVDEPKAQNYTKCFYQKMDHIDQNGDFLESLAIEQLASYGVMEETVKLCTVTAGDNKANAFYVKLYNCHKNAIDAVKDQ